MKELLSTEKSYVEDLQIVISGYRDKEWLSVIFQTCFAPKQNHDICRFPNGKSPNIIIPNKFQLREEILCSDSVVNPELTSTLEISQSFSN